MATLRNQNPHHFDNNHDLVIGFDNVDHQSLQLWINGRAINVGQQTHYDPNNRELTIPAALLPQGNFTIDISDDDGIVPQFQLRRPLPNLGGGQRQQRGTGNTTQPRRFSRNFLIGLVAAAVILALAILLFTRLRDDPTINDNKDTWTKIDRTDENVGEIKDNLSDFQKEVKKKLNDLDKRVGDGFIDVKDGFAKVGKGLGIIQRGVYGQDEDGNLVALVGMFAQYAQWSKANLPTKGEMATSFEELGKQVGDGFTQVSKDVATVKALVADNKWMLLGHATRPCRPGSKSKRCKTLSEGEFVRIRYPVTYVKKTVVNPPPAQQTTPPQQTPPPANDGQGPPVSDGAGQTQTIPPCPPGSKCRMKVILKKGEVNVEKVTVRPPTS